MSPPGPGNLRMERTVLFSSQIGGSRVTNYNYTDSPQRLLFLDALLFLRHLRALPSIALPLTSPSRLDEHYPSGENLIQGTAQGILLVGQVSMLVLSPFFFFFSTWATISIYGLFIAVNATIANYALNGDLVLRSNPTLLPSGNVHPNEKWLFINGVGTGRLWLQNSIDRLSMTFGRPVLGIHNKTYGILFDLAECLIQRSFGYATDDVRLAYATVKQTLYDPEITKVVLIAHSQGGIVASMVVDWALQELPQDLLTKLEIYTFGSAANHFNSPARAKPSITLPATLSSPPPDPVPLSPPLKSRTFPLLPIVPTHESLPSLLATAPANITLGTAQSRTIGHIEHYAHTTDFISLFSVLHFTTQAALPVAPVPSYMGRVFARTSADTGGHQFVQHYLNGMFPLEPTDNGYFRTSENSEFMESELHIVDGYAVPDSPRELVGEPTDNLGAEENWMAGDDVRVRLTTHTSEIQNKVVKVKDISRLWHYRNGQSPDDQ